MAIAIIDIATTPHHGPKRPNHLARLMSAVAMISAPKAVEAVEPAPFAQFEESRRRDQAIIDLWTGNSAAASRRQ